ncbi:MAG: FAD-dependent oxidoreductase [Bacteroidetes bacterium]|nr:FAD-dependent oxidoreductase [Bacteroidota bacterium]
MSDRFSPLPLPVLLKLTLAEIRLKRFMGIPDNLFFIPDPSDPFRMERYGKILETPVGVAAGPHSQLALNIVAAWLCGARYIELKTIQTLDELNVSKPCIDMQDEGYNCEWSQELKVEQSFREYLNAWILIHILHKELGFVGTPGVIFNMSVGYNLEGIQKENVQEFLKKMQNCTEELNKAKNTIRDIYPAIDELQIPSCISDSVTLSTMHGCPPEEISGIGHYLIEEKKLHTTIKLNPTLVGAELLRHLLNEIGGFSAEVPDSAFGHDLKYDDALKILQSLKAVSSANQLLFSVKLTNTLESLNRKGVFDKKEEMVYMSGRALHPISITLARKLQNDFQGMLDISFSAGADCFNIAPVLACGLKPVTVCSDLLKPGGYGRLWQYIDHLRREFSAAEVNSINDYIHVVSGGNEKSVEEAALLNLNNYADKVRENPAYKKSGITEPDIKTERTLEFFDCIHAPCVDTCPANQDIPGYMYHISKADPAAAFKTIFETNPFPSVTGMVCDHLCQLKCTRINYDEELRIREIKRYVAENENPANDEKPATPCGKKAAIIGAGPAGLSCAWFLRKAGFEVHVFEEKSFPGGMVSAAIPAFRLTGEAIDRDVRRILDSGVILHDNYKVDQENFETIRTTHDILFLAAGAQQSVKIDIEGFGSEGVIDPLDFLFDAKKDPKPLKGKNVVIIGGGNTAMDAARAAYRLVGHEGNVTLIYRRTIREMPADKGEIKAVQEEGIRIIELTNPERVITTDGKVSSLVSSRNVLAMAGKDGRPIPVKVPDSEFEIFCDTIIPAIGQKLSIGFAMPEQLKTTGKGYKTTIDGLYIGGDALRGASTAINAIADGRKAAEEIIADLSLENRKNRRKPEKEIDFPELMKRKSIRQYGVSPAETPLDDRMNFSLVMDSLSGEQAVEEASRCLQCDEICNVCVTVCPNLANFSYRIDPATYHLQKAVRREDGTIGFEPDRTFAVEQSWQILNIRDLCNECGNCTTFCPSSGKPFKDKPGLCLSVPTLNAEGEGYFLSRLPDRDVLIFKQKEGIKTLTLADGKYLYETENVKAAISPEDFTLLKVDFLTPCTKESYFTTAAEMSIVMKGAMQLPV